MTYQAAKVIIFRFSKLWKIVKKISSFNKKM